MLLSPDQGHLGANSRRLAFALELWVLQAFSSDRGTSAVLTEGVTFSAPYEAAANTAARGSEDLILKLLDRAAEKGTKTWLASCKLIAEEWLQQRLSPELLDEVKAKGELWVPADGQEGRLSILPPHCEAFFPSNSLFTFFVFSSWVGKALRLKSCSRERLSEGFF